ncbi:MAG: hypothetical protein KGZ88_06405 [Methylomicrobium sp.]|nr:hypothetical protein [Methylomicrobium sp.]
MKFNPNTKQLFTNEGDLIKRLHCPHGVNWKDLYHSDAIKKYCHFCGKSIIDTQNLDDDAVIAIVIQDEGVCLKLDLNDPTIRIINHNVF